MAFQLLILFTPFCVGAGYLLAILLLRVRRQNSANSALAIYVGALATLILNDGIHLAVQTSPWSITRWLFDSFILLPGPALYVYIRRSVGYSQSLMVWPWIPFFVSLTICAARAGLAAITNAEPFVGYPMYNNILDWPERLLVFAIALFNAALIVASFRHVLQWRSQILDFFSLNENRRYSWFIGLLVAATLLLMGWMFSWGSSNIVYGYITVALVLINFLLLGFAATRQHETVIPALADDRVDPTKSADDSAESAATSYSKSALSPEQLKQSVNRLQTVMGEQKLYLEGDLNASELAKAVGISQHQLSQVLNYGLKTSFYDYINRLRCDEVARCLKDSTYDALTVIEIAMQSGFSSKSSFNAKFRKVIGKTPTQFRAEAKNAMGIDSSNK